MKRLPVSTVAGTATILAYASFSLASFAFYPTRFCVTRNYLSDLGSVSSNPRGALLYNVGIIAAGALLVPFFFGFKRWRASATRRAGVLCATQAVGILEALALMMIGVYPESSGAPHAFFSYAQFFLNLVVLTLGTIALLAHPRFMKAIGAYAFVAIAFQIATLIFIVAGANSPLVEWLTVITTLLFVALLSANMSRAFP